MAHCCFIRPSNNTETVSMRCFVWLKCCLWLLVVICMSDRIYLKVLALAAETSLTFFEQH